jgi:inhibitor of KinA sporulation pathway (predicted exonuclease)
MEIPKGKITYVAKSTDSSKSKSKSLDYYCVLDFEAVYDLDWKNPEIIEFPTVIYSTKEEKMIDEFQTFVKTKLNPKLNDYCIKLTGIQQVTICC